MLMCHRQSHSSRSHLGIRLLVRASRLPMLLDPWEVQYNLLSGYWILSLFTKRLMELEIKDQHCYPLYPSPATAIQTRTILNHNQGTLGANCYHK